MKGIRGWLFLLLWGTWSIWLVLAPILEQRDSLRFLATYGKVFIGPAVVVLTAGFYRPSLETLKFAIPFFVFGLFAFFNILLQAPQFWMIGALYGGWSVAMFMVAPAFLSSRKTIVSLVKVNVVLVLIGFAIVYSINDPDKMWLRTAGQHHAEERLSLGLNSAYLGTFSAALFVDGLILYVIGGYRFMAVVVVAVGGAVSYLADARTILVFILVYALWIGWSKRAWRVPVIGIGLLVSGLTLYRAVSVLMTENAYSALDEVSSGRLSVWAELIHYNSIVNPSVWWTGNGVTRWPEVGTHLKSMHADNLYLDLVMSGGVPLLFLFVIGIVTWWKKVSRIEDSGIRLTVKAGIVAFMLSGLTATNLPTFGSLLASNIFPVLVGLTVLGGRVGRSNNVAKS